MTLSINDSITCIYLLYMTNKYETCLELNEMVYHLTGRFWNQTYNYLVGQLSGVESDNEITPLKAIKQFRKEVLQIAKNNGLTCKTSNLNGRLYFSLIPYPIYIGIDKGTGEISIATPHINTKHFQYNEYPAAISWIKNYMNIDVNPLLKQTESVRERFYLNTKASDIVKDSIQSIVRAILQRKGWRYEIHQTRLRSEIFVETVPNNIFRIDVYHKAFSQDSSLLINQLNNPHEELQEDKIHCYVLDYGYELKENELDLMSDDMKRLKAKVSIAR